jgi:hypothetical protein
MEPGPGVEEQLRDIPSPDAYVPRAEAEGALEVIETALRGGSPLAALVGPPGVGKTLLLRVLERRWAPRALFAPLAAFSPTELSQWVLALAGENSGDDPEAALRRWLDARAGQGASVRLLLDEAQSIPIETARWLGALVGKTPSQIVLAGIAGDALEKVLDALGVEVAHVRLDAPLTREEVLRYARTLLLGARLTADQRTRLLGLSDAELLEASDGIPRLVKAELRQRLGASLGSMAPSPPSARVEAPVVFSLEEARSRPAPEPPTLPRQNDPEPAVPPRLLGVKLGAAVGASVLLFTAGFFVSRFTERPSSAPLVTTQSGPPARETTAGGDPLPAPVVEVPRFGEGSEGSPRSQPDPSRTISGEEKAPSTVVAAEIARPVLADEQPPTADGAPAPRVEIPVEGTPPLAQAPSETSTSLAPGAAVGLTLQTVRVQINARPWARIAVDGRDVGVTPLGNLELAPGSHTFRADYADGRVETRTLEVREDRRFIAF